MNLISFFSSSARIHHLDLYRHFLAEFLIQPAHGKIGPVNQGGAEPQFPEGLAHLERDIAGPQEYGPRAFPLSEEFFYPKGVRQIPQMENAREVLTRDFESARHGTGGKDKMVEGELLATVELQPLILCSYPGNPGLETHCYARLRKSFGSAGDEFILILDYITDVIGGRSGGV